MDVFLHIPKAAGTTVRAIVSREYGAAATVFYEPETESFPQREVADSYLLERVSNPRVRLITGHMRYGIHEFLRQPCRYFSMLRDPIERALSEYFYAFAYPPHRYRELIVSGGMSFADFLAAKALPEAGTITHYLAGWHGGLGGPADAALYNLRHAIVTVGTSERFDESILLIARDFGWRPPLYMDRNVTRLDEGVQEQRQRVREDAFRTLREHFAGDCKIYDAADELLSQRVSALGGGFREALENFRELQNAIIRYENHLRFDEYNLEQDDELPPPAEALRQSAPYRALAQYLREAPAKPEDRRSFVGYFDGRSPRICGGWAMDMSRSAPIMVTLRRYGEHIATTLCNIPRPDVTATGFPATACGFRFNLDPPADDLGGFAVCFEDSPVRLGG